MTVILSSGLGVFLKGNTDTSWLKYQSENGHIDLEGLQSFHVCQFVQTQLSISRSGERVREGNIKLPNMTELALSDERKPLIFPPFHHQSGGEEVAVGAQTADDVICNHGPPVSRENCSDYSKWLPLSSAFAATILTVGDLLIISTGLGSIFSVNSTAAICIQWDQCQFLWGWCQSIVKCIEPKPTISFVISFSHSINCSVYTVVKMTSNSFFYTNKSSKR